MTDPMRSVPLTCHGHSRPITNIEFSSMLEDGDYFVISGSKDSHPQIRDGITGDWVGTFLGHKGAVWDARLSMDAKLAATGSADFTAKIWSTMTGECIHTIHHSHIVRAVTFPRAENPCVVATGGYEKKLRIFDLNKLEKDGNFVNSKDVDPFNQTFENNITTAKAKEAERKDKDVEGCYELVPGQHTGIIKSIVWNTDYNVLTTACDDKKIRWIDLRVSAPVHTFDLPTEPTSMGLTTLNASNTLTVTAGKKVYLFNGAHHGMMTDEIEMKYEVVSAAVDTKSNTLITGASTDTWLHFYDMDQGLQTMTLKGHHGPIWTINLSPDGKIIGTGSEDGTIKLWKNTKDSYGLWKN